MNQFLASRNIREHKQTGRRFRQGFFVIALSARSTPRTRVLASARSCVARLQIPLLIVLTFPPGYRCPADRSPLSRFTLPRSGLERSDFVLWVRFARGAPPAWTTAHPSIASVPVGCRLRREWAKSGQTPISACELRPDQQGCVRLRKPRKKPCCSRMPEANFGVVCRLASPSARQRHPHDAAYQTADVLRALVHI
jgi:hypothetical protein